jgi:hypothetical protein
MSRRWTPLRFLTVRDRPHEERPVRAGHQTGSVLIAFHAREGIDADAVTAEVEELVRALMADWYARRGYELVEALPDVA